MSGHLAIEATPSRVPLAESDVTPPQAPGLDLVCWERCLGQSRLVELEEARERLPLNRLHAVFDSDPDVRELAAVRTCQRFCVFLVASSRLTRERVEESLGIDTPPWEQFTGFEATHHLFRIAHGLDSRAPGESEVREQIRRQAETVRSRHPRPILRRLFLEAAETARARPPEIRTPSVADLAVDCVLEAFPIRRPRVVVIGTGTVGRRVAEGLAGRAALTVVFHRRPPSQDMLELTGARAVPISLISPALAGADAVVAATKSVGRVVEGQSLPSAPGAGPSLFIDLGVPRNIDPAVADLSGRTLVDLESLPLGLSDARLIALLERSAREGADRSYSDFQREGLEGWVSALRRHGEAVRQEELANALGFAGPLTDRALRAFDKMSERLARRLLEEPSETLRKMPVGTGWDWLRRALIASYTDSSNSP